MARWKREAPVQPELLEGMALRGHWQIQLRNVKRWLLGFGDAAWTDPVLSAFSRELGDVARPLTDSSIPVDVEKVTAVYDRALNLGFMPRETN